MSYTTATKPEEVVSEKTILKHVKPARYKSVGGQKVVVPPESIEETIDQISWIVETDSNGTIERHDFGSEELANNFYKEFK